MLGRVYALVARGRCAEACELAEVAEDAARLAVNPQSLSWALWVRALAATAAGDHALALRSGEECMAVGGTVDDNVISATGGWVFGATLLEAGAAGAVPGRGPEVGRRARPGPGRLGRPLHVLRAARPGPSWPWAGGRRRRRGRNGRWRWRPGSPSTWPGPPPGGRKRWS